MNNELAYVTAQEIEEIERLNPMTISDYIRNMSNEKKHLVVKLFEKEMALQLWQNVVKESY